MQAQEACESSCRPESSFSCFDAFGYGIYCFRLFVQCLRKAVAFRPCICISGGFCRAPPEKTGLGFV